MADNSNTLETLLRMLGTGLAATRGAGTEGWGAGLLALSQTMADRRKQEEQGQLAETLFSMLPDEVQERLDQQGINAPGMAEVLGKIVPMYHKQANVNFSFTPQDTDPVSLTTAVERGFGGGGLEGIGFQRRLSQKEKDYLRLTGTGTPGKEATQRVWPLASEKPQTAAMRKLDIQEREKKEAKLKERLMQGENQVATKVDQMSQMGVISKEKRDEVFNLMDRAKQQLRAYIERKEGSMTPEKYLKFLNRIQKRLLEIPSAPKSIPEPPPQTGIRKLIPDFVEQYIPGL